MQYLRLLHQALSMWWYEVVANNENTAASVSDIHDLQPLRWRHNGRDGVSNHHPHNGLLNFLFRHSSKKRSKLRVTGLWVGNSPVTGEFPAQRASNTTFFFIWWCHHEPLWPSDANLVIIGSGNCAKPCMTEMLIDHQEVLGNKFQEDLFKIQTFSFKKLLLKTLSSKCWQFSPITSKLFNEVHTLCCKTPGLCPCKDIRSSHSQSPMSEQWAPALKEFMHVCAKDLFIAKCIINLYCNIKKYIHSLILWYIKWLIYLSTNALLIMTATFANFIMICSKYALFIAKCNTNIDFNVWNQVLSLLTLYWCVPIKVL